MILTLREAAMIANRYKPEQGRENGGMSSVLICRDVHLDRPVALKYLQSGVDGGRLLDEQRALLKLRSRHVVQLFDLVSVSGAYGSESALVLEYIDGEDLQICSFGIDDRYLHCLWQVACGLTDVHDAGVVHRDIKPSNIRVDQEGVVKILDFGLSRSEDNASTRSIIGTPPFMAPELWGQTDISFSSAVDVYAFGVLAIALVSSVVPPGLSSRPPIQPSQGDIALSMVGCPPDLLGLVHGCLALSPRDRPSMSTIRDFLARSLLRGRHRANVVLGGKLHVLDSASRSITLRASVGTLRVDYDDYDFKVAAVTGSVFVNNTPAVVGMVIPGCCVLTFGIGQSRVFVTFDVSNPEVNS